MPPRRDQAAEREKNQQARLKSLETKDELLRYSLADPAWVMNRFDTTEPDGLASVRPDRPIRLNLQRSLIIAAASSREYQSRKEDVFRAALALDLAANEFRTQFSSLWSSNFAANLSSNPRTVGVDAIVPIDITQKLKNGINLSTALAYNIASLLSGPEGSAQAISLDASIEIPLARGSGSWIVAEPLTQAERNLLYAVWEFEQYKEDFSVDVAETYLNVLRQYNVVQNAEANYARLQEGTRRSEALGQSGRLPEIEVDQARQDELRAESQWIASQFDYAASLDRFKVTLGLPPDAHVRLDHAELEQLARRVAGEIAENQTAVNAPPETLAPEAEKSSAGELPGAGALPGAGGPW